MTRGVKADLARGGKAVEARSELRDFIGHMDARLRMGKSGCDEIRLSKLGSTFHFKYSTRLATSPELIRQHGDCTVWPKDKSRPKDSYLLLKLTRLGCNHSRMFPSIPAGGVDDTFI